jgi:hypothetical protein
LRYDPVLITDGRSGVREESGSTSHAGVELLGKECHAHTFTDLGEEVLSQIVEAGDELNGVSCILLLLPTCSVLRMLS